MADSIIDGFFTALRSGGAEVAMKLIAPDAIFEAQGPPSVPIYGTRPGGGPYPSTQCTCVCLRAGRLHRDAAEGRKGSHAETRRDLL